MKQWEKRKEQFQAQTTTGKNTAQRTIKSDNMGQPKNLSQLKKRLTVGAAFEIETINGELQQRRVIKAQTNAIVSIVPFDSDHKVTAGVGNWIWFESAAKWRFSDGWCAYCGNGSDAVFSIRLIDTTPEEDEQYNTWLADLEAQRTAERMTQELEKQEKQAQEIENTLTAAETAIFERGKRVNNDDIYGKCLVLRLAERYNITVPLRTAGWIAKNLRHFIVETGSTQEAGIRVWSTKKTPQGVCDVLFDILHAVDANFEELAVNSSADNVQIADTAHSDGVTASVNRNTQLAPIRLNTAVSDADKAIYSEYTKNLADGHNTARIPDTS